MRNKDRFMIVKEWLHNHSHSEIKAAAKRAKVSLNTVMRYKEGEFTPRTQTKPLSRFFNVICTHKISRFEVLTGYKRPKTQEGLMGFIRDVVKKGKNGQPKVVAAVKVAVAFFADRDSIDITHLNTEQRAHVLTALLEAEEVIKEVNNG